MNMRSYKCCTAASPLSIDIENTAKLLKILAEPNRLRIMCVLNNEREHCVCEFAEHLPDVSQSLLSHHLADLKEASLVQAEKRGQRVYYQLTRAGKQAMNQILQIN